MRTKKKPITLICLPFAGGSEASFNPLITPLQNEMYIRVVEYSGRGKRFSEPLHRSLDALVEDTWKQMRPWMQQPYVLLGHSMGALIAYLICHKIRELDLSMPLHLFLSGKECPSIPCLDRDHLLSKSAFKDRLITYGGMPDELLKNDEFFSFFEPIIRADMQAIETWEYTPRPKLSIPVTVLNGREDDLTEEEIKGWQSEFSNTIQFQAFSGGHFFLFEQAEAFATSLLTGLYNTNNI